MKRSLAVLAMLAPLAAPAQLVQPDESHYAVAYDALATRIAAERLEVAQAESIRLAAAIRALRDALERDRAHQDAVVDAWAGIIQRAHGIRPGSHKPGTGYYLIHRADE